jgi:hypothetical protein
MDGPSYIGKIAAANRAEKKRLKKIAQAKEKNSIKAKARKDKGAELLELGEEDNFINPITTFAIIQRPYSSTLTTLPPEGNEEEITEIITIENPNEQPLPLSLRQNSFDSIRLSDIQSDLASSSPHEKQNCVGCVTMGGKFKTKRRKRRKTKRFTNKKSKKFNSILNLK